MVTRRQFNTAHTCGQNCSLAQEGVHIDDDTSSVVTCSTVPADDSARAENITVPSAFFRFRYSLGLEALALRQQLGGLKRNPLPPRLRIQGRIYWIVLRPSLASMETLNSCWPEPAALRGDHSGALKGSRWQVIWVPWSINHGA